MNLCGCCKKQKECARCFYCKGRMCHDCQIQKKLDINNRNEYGDWGTCYKCHTEWKVMMEEYGKTAYEIFEMENDDISSDNIMKLWNYELIRCCLCNDVCEPMAHSEKCVRCENS